MITREKNSLGTFIYYQNNKKIIDPEILARCAKLRVPPAWKYVQISEDPTSYLQVTGIDLSGKMQYIYHPLFISLTEYHKYNHLKEFCLRLPLLHAKIKSIKKTTVTERNYLICLIFRIMEKTHARIGNDHYLEDGVSRSNPSYGLTTLNNNHIKISDDKITLDFIGKHGIRQNIEFVDKSIALDLLELKKINKDRIFIDSNGSCIRSNDVNDFLKEAMLNNYTCKDFRTYASNKLFITTLKNIPRGNKSKEEILKETSSLVAKELGHTDAVSKKSYVIPAISEKFMTDEKYFNSSKDPVKLLINLI